jgi:hypothetical protein
MRYWQTFWMFWLVIAGLSFAVITVIVAVRGYKDLRNMFTGLASQKDDEQ